MNKEHLKIKVSDLKANPKNPKQHDDKLIKDSIQDLGFVDDIVIDEKNVILAGHGRLKALEELGTKEIDVIKISGWTQEQKDRYLLLSNKSVEKGGWDFEMLAQIDKELLKQVGFESQELDKIFKDLNKDDDEVPEVPEKPTSKLGEIYQLGKHRLVCGDALKRDDVEKLMNGVKANMVFTDPPYNVDYGVSKKQGNKIRKIKNDNLSADDWEIFCKSLYEIFRQYNKGDIYMWGAPGPDGMKMRLWLTEIGCHWSATIIWKKQQLVLSPAKYQRMYEPCFYGWFDQSSYCGSRKETEVWEIDRPLNSKLHPTMKPVELCEKAITNSSKRGDIVLDVFGGSGSTLIACEQLDRKCYMMELDPRYTDVIISRWENFTKLKAKKLWQKKKIFAEVK